MTPEVLDQAAAIFGWMTVINLGLYLYAAFFILFKREWMMDMHVRMMGVEREKLPGRYFSYLASYKLMIITLNLTPWLALKIVG